MADEQLQGGFDLKRALWAIDQDDPAFVEEIKIVEAAVRESRQDIVAGSRKNFILERQLTEIDEKIALLVKNQITVQEVLKSAGKYDNKTAEDVDGVNKSPIHGKKALYQDLFYLLQNRPIYFARMARVCNAKEIPTFVQTVVLDMYGDQYDTREERLLLSVFKHAIEFELDESQNMGSLLRANTGITQMLSAYSKRGQGLTILKKILEAPLRQLTSQKDLNLEVSPSKVYAQLLKDFETSTGKTSDRERNVTEERAAEDQEVLAIIEKRRQELEKLADYILGRIIDGVENVPYGMRWICKQLGVLSKNKFPDATEAQISSLMGGYIYLRFFNPAIVTPDAINFTQSKIDKKMRRNLILIAKVLQNLSNGIEFGKKERYLTVLNGFVMSKRDELQKYFRSLAAVDELDDSLQVDRFLEHTGRLNCIQVSYNQIFLAHRLICNNPDIIMDGPDDPLASIISRLGDPPPDVVRDRDHVVTLNLVDRTRKSQAVHTADNLFKMHEHNPLYLQTKELLLGVLRVLPKDSIKSQNLLGFLAEQKRVAMDAGDGKLAEQLTNLDAMLKALTVMKVVEMKGSLDDTYNNFLWGFAQEILHRNTRKGLLDKRLTMISDALKTIDCHHAYLQSRLELYLLYLENVKKGREDRVGQKKKTKRGRKKRTDGHGRTVVKFSHEQLKKSKLIVKLNLEVKPKILTKLTYIFTKESPGNFKVELALKKGIDVKLPMRPVPLVLEDLLQQQEEGVHILDVGDLELNLNLLIFLLNTEFLA